jgi:serine/threonine-protein kinase
VPAPAVRAQLLRILQSPAFSRAPRLRRFLTFAVDAALAGRIELLKEYTLGVDVFDRGATFDPKTDPIVRVDARRLRKAIRQYYAGEGAGDPVEIDLPTGSYLPVFRLRTTERPQRRRGLSRVRLAVAPFAAAADDALAARFAEGLTDEVLLALTQRPELQVIAAPMGLDEPARIATNLAADVVLTGKVRRPGDSLRVHAALSGADGALLWADKYEANLADTAELVGQQDRLAERIAALVAPRLNPPWIARSGAPTADPEAYELYLRGRHALNATRPDTLALATSLLDEAAARDPRFAEAIAARAEADVLAGVFLTEPPAAALEAARARALAALALDAELASAHTTLATVAAMLDHDFAAAGRAIDRALSASPLAAATRQTRAYLLLAPQGRLDEAESELAALLDREPYSLRLRNYYAQVLLFQRRFDSAIRQLELVLEFEPNFPGAAFTLAYAQEHVGDIARARAAHARHVRQIPYPLVARWLEAANAIWDGRADEARSVVEAMEGEAGPLAASVMADAWLRLGDHGRAIAWLERAADARLQRAIYIGVDPFFIPLRPEPSFAALLRRVGLPVPSGPI